MALIKCNECGKEISDNAKQCPHCGVELKKDTTTLKIVVISIITMILTIFIIWFFFIASPKDIINDIKEQNKVKDLLNDYYGTYTLTNDNFKELNGKHFITISENSIAKQEINITKENIVNKGGAFEVEKDFSLFAEDENNYYILIKLKTLIPNIDKSSGEKIICMKSENNKLVQKTCWLDDNTTAPNVNIEYTKTK